MTHDLVEGCRCSSNLSNCFDYRVEVSYRDPLPQEFLQGFLNQYSRSAAWDVRSKFLIFAVKPAV